MCISFMYLGNDSIDLETAYDMGAAAFKNGINCAALDEKFVPKLSPVVGSNIEMLKAWNRGWTITMLNSMPPIIEDVDGTNE